MSTANTVAPAAKNGKKSTPAQEVESQDLALEVEAPSRSLATVEMGDIDALLAKANKALDAAASAKAEAFQRTESDFWKPETEGDALQGVYLGAGRKGAYLQHIIGRKGKDGKPQAVAVNGTTTLTSAMRHVEPGTAVRIVYKGETKTADGKRLRLYEVGVFK